MDNTFNDCLIEDINILQKVKPNLDVNEYVIFLRTKLSYSNILKKNLYNETENFLEVYNNFVINIINSYIKCVIDKNELNKMLEWKFDLPSKTEQNFYNRIFPQFIELLINNIQILDEDRKMCEIKVIKPSLKTQLHLSDSDEEEEIVLKSAKVIAKKQIVNRVEEEEEEEEVIIKKRVKFAEKPIVKPPTKKSTVTLEEEEEEVIIQKTAKVVAKPIVKPPTKKSIVTLEEESDAEEEVIIQKTAKKTIVVDDEESDAEEEAEEESDAESEEDVESEEDAESESDAESEEDVEEEKIIALTQNSKTVIYLSDEEEELEP